MRFKLKSTVTWLAVLAIAAPLSLSAGKIVINSDEWTLSNAGFANAGGSNTANFAVNLATFLAGPGGNILIYSSNFGLTQSSLSTTLTGAGFSVTTTTGAFNPVGFDAVFLAQSLHSATTSDLVNFVNGGGGVYIGAGTNSSNPGLAAGLFNPFLGTFGLTFENFHNLFSANDPIDNAAHPLFGGVAQLYYNGVNPVATTGSSPSASVVEVRSSTGLIAVFDDTSGTPSPSAPIPEPSTFGLLGAALCALALATARHRETGMCRQLVDRAGSKRR